MPSSSLPFVKSFTSIINGFFYYFSSFRLFLFFCQKIETKKKYFVQIWCALKVYRNMIRTTPYQTRNVQNSHNIQFVWKWKRRNEFEKRQKKKEKKPSEIDCFKQKVSFILLTHFEFIIFRTIKFSRHDPFRVCVKPKKV